MMYNLKYIIISNVITYMNHYISFWTPKNLQDKFSVSNSLSWDYSHTRCFYALILRKQHSLTCTQSSAHIMYTATESWGEHLRTKFSGWERASCMIRVVWGEVCHLWMGNTDLLLPLSLLLKFTFFQTSVCFTPW